MAKDYYSVIAKSYDKLHAEEQLAKARLIKSRAKMRGFLLDIGAGTCVSTRAFEKASFGIVAIDPSFEMLEQCKSKKILRVCARAEELPFKSACFDSVVSITALHHADLKKAFLEIKRVARQRAQIGVSFFKRSKSLGRAKRIFSKFECIDNGNDLVFLHKQETKPK